MVLPMARDLGKYKIRVMNIAPGMMDTPMAGRKLTKIHENLKKSSPL
jgi:NAD(P)-dependent dehydrogenase (short-subunit alcohol dehydrogenase family)